MKHAALIMLLLFSVTTLYAQTGTADIDPKAIAVGAYHPVIQISYKPDAGTAFTGGSISIKIPEGFTPPPTTLNDNLTAVIMAGNLTVSAVDALNISIDNYAVTINAVTLAAGQELVVTYGNLGAGGIYPPNAPGKYVFEVSEKTSLVSSFTALEKHPYLYITYVMIDKYSPSVSVKAGDTVTYYLEYKNVDGGYPVSSLSAWDTMPAGMTYLSSAPPATFVTGSYLRWDVGNVLSSSAVKITVVAMANQGIINFGEQCVNSASVSAIHPMNGLNLMEVKNELPVEGVKLETSFMAFPDNVQTYQDITLVMGITNAGNMMAVMVSGTVQAVSDGGSVMLYTSPSPEYASGLAMGQSAYFTWIYKGTGAGSVHFEGYARAMENTFTVTSIQAGTNYVNIAVPTPTFTGTPVIPTFTPTDTPVVPTETFTQVITTPVTPVVTPAVTLTPQAALTEKVLTDKNYINLTNSDKVEIKYLVESAGNVTIRIYNLSGEEIRGFNQNTLFPGTYYVNWDGTNTAGKKVGKGLYFISVNQPGGKTIRKIIVTK